MCCRTLRLSSVLALSDWGCDWGSTVELMADTLLLVVCEPQCFSAAYCEAATAHAAPGRCSGSPGHFRVLMSPRLPLAGVVDICLIQGVPFEVKISKYSTAGVVDICLIPEVPFELPKLLEHVDKILAAKGHCVVCVAEGAGQNLAQVRSQH